MVIRLAGGEGGEAQAEKEELLHWTWERIWHYEMNLFSSSVTSFLSQFSPTTWSYLDERPWALYCKERVNFHIISCFVQSNQNLKYVSVPRAERVLRGSIGSR